MKNWVINVIVEFHFLLPWNNLKRILDGLIMNEHELTIVMRVLNFLEPRMRG
jgi:hypothetical protein